jgi:hypothetical protein
VAGAVFLAYPRGRKSFLPIPQLPLLQAKAKARPSDDDDIHEHDIYDTYDRGGRRTTAATSSTPVGSTYGHRPVFC